MKPKKAISNILAAGAAAAVLIGYPIWWQSASWVTYNFVKDNDFTGKTVIPFTSSASSPFGDSAKLLEEYAEGGEWLEGMRFQSNEDIDAVKEWAAGLLE